MSDHVILDLPPLYKGGKPGRRCCVCELIESLCEEYRDCKGKPIHAMGTANSKTASRARKRKRTR